MQPEKDDELDAPSRQHLCETGATRLKIALAPALMAATVLLALMLGGKVRDAALWTLVGLTVATYWIGSKGIARIVVGRDLGAQAYGNGRFALMVPGVGVAALLYFLFASKVPRQAALREPSAAEQARRRARERASAPKPARADSANANAQRSVHEIAATVLPAVKAAGLSKEASPSGPLEFHLGSDAPAVGSLSPGQALPQDSQPALHVTSDGFAVVYLVDEGSHYRWFTLEELRRADMTLEQLHKRSLRNLVAMVNSDKPGLRVAPNEGFFALLMGGQFESSLVLLDELWDRILAPQAPNGAVMMVAARDLCAFCDAADARALANLRRVAEQAFAQADRPITGQLYRRREGRWVEHAAA